LNDTLGKHLNFFRLQKEYFEFTAQINHPAASCGVLLGYSISLIAAKLRGIRPIEIKKSITKRDE